MPLAPQWTWTEVPVPPNDLAALEAEIRQEDSPTAPRFALSAAGTDCPRVVAERDGHLDELTESLMCLAWPLLDEGGLTWTPTALPEQEVLYVGKVYARDEGWVLNQAPTGLRASRRRQVDDVRVSMLLSFGNIHEVRELAWWDAEGHLVRYLRYELSTGSGDYWGPVPFIESLVALDLTWRGDALIGVSATLSQLPHDQPSTDAFDPLPYRLELVPGQGAPQRLAITPLYTLALDRFPAALSDDDPDTGLTVPPGQALSWSVLGGGGPAEALRIRVTPGCGANDDVWFAQGRPRSLKVTAVQWDRSYGTVSALEKSVWWIVDLDSSPGQMAVTERALPPGFHVDAVEIRAVEIRPGKQVQGWCLSGLEVLVRAAEPYEPPSWAPSSQLPAPPKLTRGAPTIHERTPRGDEVLAQVERARARAASFDETQPRVAVLSKVEEWLPLGPAHPSPSGKLWLTVSSTLRRFLHHPGPGEPATGALPHDRAAVGPLPVRLQQSAVEPSLWRVRSWRQECEGRLSCYSEDELILDYDEDKLRWAYVRSNSTTSPKDVLVELTWLDGAVSRALVRWRDVGLRGAPDTFGELELQWSEGK